MGSLMSVHRFLFKRLLREQIGLQPFLCSDKMVYELGDYGMEYMCLNFSLNL